MFTSRSDLRCTRGSGGQPAAHVAASRSSAARFCVSETLASGDTSSPGTHHSDRQEQRAHMTSTISRLDGPRRPGFGRPAAGCDAPTGAIGGAVCPGTIAGGERGAIGSETKRDHRGAPAFMAAFQLRKSGVPGYGQPRFDDGAGTEGGGRAP